MRVVMKVLKLINGFIFSYFFGDESVCGERVKEEEEFGFVMMIRIFGLSWLVVY
jgi:hypothetical protein